MVRWKRRSAVSLLLFGCIFLIQVVLSTRPSNDPEKFFRSLDRDADGDLDADELRRVIRETGVEQFDEQHEVEVGVQTALTLDRNNDNSLSHKDLVSQWVAMASLMTPETVGDWLTHAVGLRYEMADKFILANWTGLDLPRLLYGNADQLLNDIKVHVNRAEKAKLVGAIKLRMLNVGRIPHAPELRATDSSKSARCGVIMLSWNNPARSFPEIHKYRLYRRASRDDDLPENPWTLVFEGHTTAFTDRVKDVGPQFDYKIEAWNLVGQSIPTELHDVVPSRRGCDSSSWLSRMFNLFSDIHTYTMNIFGLVTFVYFVFKVTRSEPEITPSRREKNFRNPTAANEPAPSADSSGVPLFLTNGGSFYQKASSSSIVLEGETESGSSRLPELNTELISPINRFTVPQTIREYSPDRCVECGKPVTRTTRHQCGMCLHVFCTKHTAIHPHLETTLPFMGKVVLSTCGINSKCRCYPCAGIPRTNSNSEVASNGSAQETEGKKRWKHVKRNMLERKTVRAWRRKSEESNLNEAGLRDLSNLSDPAANEDNNIIRNGSI